VRKLVIAEFKPSAAQPSTLEGRFDIAVPHLGSREGTPELD